MPDPNTTGTPGIDYPDIHVHIEAIFHCTVCDNVMVGCYTCHEAMCYDDDEEEIFYIPGLASDGYVLRECDPLTIFWEYDDEGDVAIYDAATGEAWSTLHRIAAVCDELLSRAVRRWRKVCY